MSFCLRVFSFKKNALTYLCEIPNASVQVFGIPCWINAWAFVMSVDSACVLCFGFPYYCPLEMPAVLNGTPSVMVTAPYIRLRMTSQFTSQAAPKISHTLLIGTNK